MKTNETNIVDLFPENEERESQKENPDIENLVKDVREQMKELHFWEKNLSDEDIKNQEYALSLMEKDLLHAMKKRNQKMVRDKLFNQFENWLKRPFWLWKWKEEGEWKKDNIIHLFWHNDNTIKKAA